MISLILPPKSQIALSSKMLQDEYGTASNIKSRVNRLSVLTAITSTQQVRLRASSTRPPRRDCCHRRRQCSHHAHAELHVPPHHPRRCTPPMCRS